MISRRRRGLLALAAALAWSACDDAVTSTGVLQVTTVTSGTQRDENGYRLLIDSVFTADLQPNGVMDLPMAEGLYRVQLSEIATTCTVDGDNPATSFVGGDTIRALTFRVECGPGTLTVTTATSGTGTDPDGYILLVDDVQVGTPALSGSISVPLEPGSHSVRLGGIATGCTASGTNPRTVTIARNRTATTTFTLTCTAPPPT
jgi:hypothetical protein